MAKSESDIVGNKLRIRAGLHRRLVQAAGKGGVSLNSEMARRLQASIDQESVEQAIAEKVGEKIHQVLGAVNLTVGAPVISGSKPLQTGHPVQSGVAHQLQANLIVATEALITAIEQMPVLEREAIKAAIKPVRKAIADIDRNALAELRRSNPIEGETGEDL